MDVSQEQLLHQVVQVVMQVLLLHPEQLQLVHGKVKLPGAVEAAALLPQLVGQVGLPGAPHGPPAALVEAQAELLGHGGRVTHHLDVVEVVLGLRATADDPGGLAEAQAAADHQGVAGFGAVVVLVVKLVSLEGVVGEEAVGTRQELWSRSHLTALGEKQGERTQLF